MYGLDDLISVSRSIVNEIYTTELAVVEAFYPQSCTIDATLMIINTNASGEREKQPITLRDIPVRFPQMGNFVMYSPLVKGDTVYLHFSRRDWDNWLISQDKSRRVLPASKDRFDINCSYAEVGARNPVNPAADQRFLDKTHLAQGENGEQYITMSDEGIVINAGATKVTITNTGGIQIDPAGNVEISNGNIQVTGGDVIADGISLKNHTHGYTDDGTPAQTTPPTGGTP